MGVYPHGRGELASADNAFTHARLFVLWRYARRAPFHECSFAYRSRDFVVSSVLVNDDLTLAKRFCRGRVCGASVARRIGGLDCGTQGCLKRRIFMLTIGMYVQYARRPGVLGYVGILVCFALGLM